MEAAPHLAFWPGLALTITVYSLNMFGGAVRDLLDPRLRGGTDPKGYNGEVELGLARSAAILARLWIDSDLKQEMGG